MENILQTPSSIQATQSSQKTRAVVEQYLQYFAKSDKNVTQLKSILADNLHFTSPLGEFFTADSFLCDLQRNALAVRTLDMNHIIVQENKACALYVIHSNDPGVGAITLSEWFEINDGVITKIRSTYDASDVRKSMAQI